MATETGNPESRKGKNPDALGWSRCRLPPMAQRKPGRPRTRRPDLQPFTARLTPEAKKRLMALAQVTGVPAYTLLEEAFWTRWKDLPTDRREAADAIVRAIEKSRETSEPEDR